MKRRKHKKNFIRNRSGGMKQKLPGRLLSLMCALILVLSTVFLDLGHVSRAYAFGDEFALETEEGDIQDAGIEAQVMDIEDDQSEISTELSDDTYEDPDEITTEADDAGMADFSSGENLTEQDLEVEDSAEDISEDPQPLTFRKLINNDTVEVIAEAPAGALPEGTELVVKEIKNNTDDAEMTEQYNRLSARITEQLQNQGKNLDGFLPYNISFTDMDGNPVKPSEKVTYSFHYTEAAAPELTDPSASTVTAAQLKENKETAQLDMTELKAEEDKLFLETNESRQLQKAAFQAADNAVYTFIWSSTPAADNNGEADNEETQEPESEPTQIGTIRLLVDEVNLRTAPSMEADVIGTADAGTELPLLEIITAEDGSTWYKVSYSDTVVYVSGEVAEVVEAEETPAEEAPAEITRYVYESDEVNVKVTLTNPEDLPDDAELSVTPVELSQEAEEQITQEAIEEKKAIEKIRAYDIKFLVNGEEIQPGASVKVEVSFPEEESIEDANVYHVDEKEKVQNMDGSVNKEGNVEFETTHFSTYVIVNNKIDGSKITVTVQHYEQATGTEEAKKIYADDVRELQVGQQVDCKKALNWDIAEVKVNTGDSEDKTVTPDASGKIYLAQNATVKVYYTPSTGTTVGRPTFYDYTVKAVSDGDASTYGYPSINQNSNYPSGASSTERITMGAYTHQYSGTYQYTWKKDNYTVNDWTGTPSAGEQPTVIKGLLGGVTADNSVVFNYPEPGLFVNSDMTDSTTGKSLRKVYKDFKLGFERNGDTYTLKDVRDSSGTDVAGANGYDYESGNNFFPLDKVSYNEYSKKYKSESHITQSHNGPHNYYFGMRYDITFQLKDYIGDLNYSFTGDDDMWVVLDKGKYEKGSGKVIIDLGGIHDAASADVDLWDVLYDGKYKNNREGVKKDGKSEEEHTLTVLYLERGAGLSNCKMNFTLPNAEISSVTTTDLASFTFTKVKKDNKTPLPGATFKLYTDSECTTEFKTKTSGTDGIVTFDKLFPGTYYMKEVQAPDGYVASSEVWTVKVPTGSTTATLKDSKGNTVTSIINETPEEIINSSMVASKTAKVKDWDQRTYDITINATSTSTSTITQTKTPIADIMLVLDVSGSMGDPIYSYVADNTSDGRSGLDTTRTYYIYTGNSYKQMRYYSNYGRYGWYVSDGYYSYKADDYSNNCKIYTYTGQTRLDALKTAVNQFIDDTSKKSPNSKIGITTFSSDGYTNHKQTKGLGTTVTDLKQFVHDLNANGGTNPSVGLNVAKDELEKVNKDGNPKYVILFTDGAPTGGRTDKQWDTDVVNKSNKAADALKKNKFSTVYTILFGVGENSREQAFLKGGEYNGTTYSGIASSSECAKTADDAASLTQIFQSISSSISENIDITGATITDVIDKRFEIMDQDENGNYKVITDKDFNQEHKYTLQNGGVVTKREDGTYQVQWTDQTIKYTGNAKEDGWSQTITVKAKDSFIGGNNIPTNVSPESKISVGDLDKVLDQPKVNVKVKLLIQDKEITIYKGDTTVPKVADVQKAMFDTSGTTSYESGTISAADAKDRITYQWYKKDASGNRVDIAAADVKKEIETAPADSTEYYLEVIYKPVEEPTDDSKSNTTTGDGTAHFVGDEKAHNKNNNENLYGTYKINVIKGKIQIKKTVTEATNEERTFTFNVKDSTGKDVSGSLVNVIVGADQTEGTAAIENLPRGSYTVTENTTDGYTIQTFDIVTGEGETDCDSSKSTDESKSLTFVLGNGTNKANVINNYTYNPNDGGVNGVASYTNEMVTKLDLKKIAADTKNSLTGAKFKLEKKVSDNNWDPVKPENSDNGFEVLNGDNQVELTNLTSGDYRLTEITAPAGYMVLSSEIKFNVTQGKVTLTNAEGTASNMWELSTDTTKPPVLTIKNQKVYSLPEAGGNGIYWYMIGGMLLMVTSAWILYKNKCKEVLGK